MNFTEMNETEWKWMKPRNENGFKWMNFTEMNETEWKWMKPINENGFKILNGWTSLKWMKGVKGVKWMKQIIEISINGLYVFLG